MKKSFFIIGLGSILIFGCSKKKVLEEQSQLSQISNPNLIPQKKDGGDDDDDPIVMEVTKDADGNPIDGSFVIFFNGQDTLNGLTDVNGNCRFTLTHSGAWELSIYRQGYVCVNQQINIVDSFTTRIDTLRPGQCH